MTKPTARRNLLTLLLILGIAALLRAWLIASDGVAFESDEAIVGLMARHINQGAPLPTFYYGQPYMGSLDAILVAGGFQLLGESVEVIRVVQAVLYLLAVGAGYGLARVVTHSARVAAMAALLLAIPTPLAALYTTASLGGYNELVLLGSVVLLLSWQVTAEGHDEPWRWAALGLAAGVGWWVNGAIVTACLVAGLLVLRTFAIGRWSRYGLAALAFMIGSAPWWLYNVGHDWIALDFLLGGFEPVPGSEPIGPGEALMGLVLLGLPAIYGLRLPWSAHFVTGASVIAALVVYLLLATDMFTALYARVRYRRVPDRPARVRALRWVVLVFGVFTLAFTLSSFSDATGRYLMPLWTPAAVGVALGIDRLRRIGTVWGQLGGEMAAAAALAALLTFQAGTVLRVAGTEPGLTPQLIVRLHTPAIADAALIDFLTTHGPHTGPDGTLNGTIYGYADYWTAYRVAFRTGERVILAPALPYELSGYKPGNDRYPAYSEAVAQAAQNGQDIVWVTQNFPELDALIARYFAAAGIAYRARDIGPYRVYYDLSAPVAPSDFGFDSGQTVGELAARAPGSAGPAPR